MRQVKLWKQQFSDAARFFEMGIARSDDDIDADIDVRSNTLQDDMIDADGMGRRVRITQVSSLASAGKYD